MNETSTFRGWEEEQGELEEDRLRRENAQFKQAFECVAKELSRSKLLNEELQKALMHCVNVFRAQAERGAYPKELLPDCTEYLGKAGFKFILDLMGN